jgi:hypothetical protein
MLTDFMVSCPHPGCQWSGSLLPHRNHDAWRTAVPTTKVIVFHCPHCQGEWLASVDGDDAHPLPLEQAALTGA